MRAILISSRDSNAATRLPARQKVAHQTGPANGSPSRLRRHFGRVADGRTLAAFTRQFATLIKAGMPILRGLEVLARQEKRPAFRAVIATVVETIRAGGTLSDGLAIDPKIFDRLYVNMVRAGEAGGHLDVVLDRVAGFLEKRQRIAGKVKAALVYPLIIVAVAITIVSVLMVFVVPKFQGIFAGQMKGQPLPALTQGLITVSHFFSAHFVIAAAGVAACVIGLRLAGRTRPGRRAVDRMALRAPMLGDLVLKAGTARFARTFGTLLGSGVPILQALLITRDTTGNVHLVEALDIVHRKVQAGENVARPLEATRAFPAMVASMIEVGEETGALPQMLSRIADTYDDEVDNAIAALTSVIEPIMILIMAGVVGTIVIALLLPLVSIIQNLT
jgi:type IV pilus assembly protein PilC